MTDLSIAFKAADVGPVAQAFMRSTAFVRGIRGPVGSAKSSTSTVECLRMMLMQEPSPSGVRKTRGAVIRNTNPMLRTTTLNTWKEWIPEQLGPIRMHPPPFEQELLLRLPDRTELAAEIYFLALDRPEDMKKLLSLELTWAWINEARETGKTLVDGVTQRLSRYPRIQDGGATRPGLIMDTNSPDDDHWWPIMAGDVPPPEGMSDEEIRQLVKPDDWEFFEQPPAMLEKREKGRLIGYEVNPKAENLKNLDPLYYSRQIAGKTKAYVDVYILNRYGATHDGRPVHAAFSKDTHVSKTPLTPWPGVPLIVSCDFGLTPAALFRQKLRGRYQVLAEICLADGGAVDLAKAINRMMLDRFPGLKIGKAWGDPSGDNRVQTDKRTPFQVMRAAGIPCRPTETNDPDIRRAATNQVYSTLIEGKPMEIVDPSCKTYIAGMEGAWCYKRVLGSAERFEDAPLKNRYSHICEAGEYGHVGEGEHRLIMGRQKTNETRVSNTRPQGGGSSPLARFSQQRRSVSAWKPGARVR